MSLTGDSGNLLDQQSFFARLDGMMPTATRIAVALSGGPDSKALVLLCHDWTQARGRTLCALTVDHGLRPEARVEAEQMAHWCAALGIEHHILTVTEALPATGVQEAARDVRYDLMADHCHKHDIPVLLTAHHRDDQAETILMRLSRGSGVDGLTGMAVERPLSPDVRLIRPLLDVDKESLKGWLAERGENWVEDPSNQDTDFTRVRWRALTEPLAQEGLDAERLAGLSGRMRDVVNALDWTTDSLAERHLVLNPLGHAEVRDMSSLIGIVPDHLLLRLLRRAIIWTCPQARISLEKLERLVGHWSTDKKVGAATLSGCRLMPVEMEDRLLVVRETRGLPEVDVVDGSLVWDGRFEVSGAEAGSKVRMLGDEGWSRVKALDEAGLPAYAIARVTPSVWQGEKLIASALLPDMSPTVRFLYLAG